MKKSLTKVASIGLAVVLLGSLAACGDDSTAPRNRNSALEPVACLNAANSSLTAENKLRIPACAQAAKWAVVKSDGSDGDSSVVADGFIELPVITMKPTTVKTFDAEGNVVGIDVVKVNGSRGGMVYRIDKSGEVPTYFEVAPSGWSGSRDPKVKWAEIKGLIASYNNESSPTADWFFGNEWEMRTILFSPDLSNAADINVEQGCEYFYWTNGFVGIRPIIERPSTSQCGYTAIQTWTITYLPHYVRPVRSFTTGTESVASIVPTLVPASSAETPVDESSSSVADESSTSIADETPATPVDESSTSIADETPTTPVDESSTSVVDESSTTTSDESTTTTVEAATSTTTPKVLSDEEKVETQVLTPIEEVVTLPREDKKVTIQPEAVKEMVAQAPAGETPTIEVSFDGEKWNLLSTTQATQLVIPASATSIRTRFSGSKGEEAVVEKQILREGEDASEVSTTTSTSVAPTSADDMPDEGVTTDVSGESDSSSNLWIFIVAGIVIIAIAGAGVQRSRKKK